MRMRVLALAVLLSRVALSGESAVDFKVLLNEAGVKGGLCVAVGLDAAGAKALVNESRLFVQLVAPDDQTALDWMRVLDGGRERSEISVVSHGVNPLPYARDVANLLLVRGEANCPSAAEVRRVLTPGGAVVAIGAPAAFAADAAKLGLAQANSSVATVFRKAPLPAAEDWGTMAGGPELGNSLPDSTLEPTLTLRWRADPRWQARDYHDDLFACGSGTLLYRQIAVAPATVDQFVPHLIARDAYNGRELWRHVGQPVRRPLYGFNVQPLLAVGEGRVCVELDGKMTCLDAATGQVLFVPQLAKPARTVRIYGPYLVFGGDNSLSVHALADGRALWTKPMAIRTSAAIKGETIFRLAGKAISACRLDTGEDLWSYDTGGDAHPDVECRTGPFCTQSAVHYVKGGKEKTFVFALGPKTGKPLWNAEADNPRTVYPEVKDMEPSLGLIAFNDEVWFKFKKNARPKPGYTAVMTCFDAATGKEKRRNFTMDNETTHCWGNKGAGRFLLYGRNQFVDRQDQSVAVNSLVRSICAIGHIPAERQLFYLPHNCRCGTLIRGVLAMGAPEAAYDFSDQAAPVPVRMNGAHRPQADAPADWPMFRGNAPRSSSVKTDIGSELAKKWETPVGGPGLSQAVSAYGMVFVSDAEGQRVVALDAGNGAIQWAFPTGSRVSYPPALHQGLCLFGTAAGWVWALDARTGAPVWKLRAAPAECYLGSRDRFESRWPVVGDVLVQGGVGYVSAGRAGLIDGGVQVVAFDPATGQTAWRQAFTNAVSADLLVGTPAGDGFLMNARRIDPAARTIAKTSVEMPGCLNLVLYSIGGIGTYTALDDYLSSHERNHVSQRRELLGDRRIAGLNVAFNEKVSVATARVPKKDVKEALAPEHRLLAADVPKKIKWDHPTGGFRVDGLAVGPEKIYWVGGSPTDDLKGESTLQVWSVADGTCLKSLAFAERAIPDGLSIAGGRLFIVTRSGKVMAFEGK